jgi:hypothetical protein
VILLLAGVLAGCATAEYAFVLQDRYSSSSCAEIATARTPMLKREEELTALIQKADSGFGGFIVSTTTYRSELEQTRAHLKALAVASREKGCDTAK